MVFIVAVASSYSGAGCSQADRRWSVVWASRRAHVHSCKGGKLFLPSGRSKGGSRRRVVGECVGEHARSVFEICLLSRRPLSLVAGCCRCVCSRTAAFRYQHN